MTDTMTAPDRPAVSTARVTSGDSPETPTEVAAPPGRTALIIEGNAGDRELLSAAFREAGFHVHAVGEGDTGLILARETTPTVVVLDLDVPQLAGNEVLRAIRRNSAVPVLAMSGRRSEADRIRTLDLGADDVLTKPVGTAEVMAHVRALLRRSVVASPRSDQAAEVIRFGDCELNTASNVLRKSGVTIPLRPQERRLLEFLAQRPGRTFTREQILNAIWGGGANITVRTVDVHVRWLREKVEDEPSTPRHLLTVRGAGYRFDIEPDRVRAAATGQSGARSRVGAR